MKTNKIEIIEFTDPVCTWCWGSEPILRKLDYMYSENLEINFVMGGLVKDARTFRDEANDIGGDLTIMNSQVAEHWLEASARHGMPVDVTGFDLFTDEHYSTYPMNIAFKAAEFQGSEIAKKFLRRIREAVSSEGRMANRTEVLIELASEVGLDISRFMDDFESGSAEKAFQEDLDKTLKKGARGFPTFLVKSREGKEVLLRGYQSYESFKKVISHISNDFIEEIELDRSINGVIGFVKQYGRVASIEIKTAFDFTESEMAAILKELEASGNMSVSKVGNGLFVSVIKAMDHCDSDTGLCGF